MSFSELWSCLGTPLDNLAGWLLVKLRPVTSQPHVQLCDTEQGRLNPIHKYVNPLFIS